MSGDSGQGNEVSPQAFLEKLEESGFFQQITNLEDNLRTIASDLQSLGKTATERLEETESLAAHVFAIEAILTAILKSTPVDAEAIKEEIKNTTSSLSGNPDGSPAVQMVASELLAKAGK